MDWAMLLHDYGWSAVLLLVVMERLFPLVQNYLLPTHAAKLKRQAGIEDEERARRANLEERQVRAMEGLEKALNQLNVLYTKTEQRVENVERDVAQVRTDVAKLVDRERPTQPRRHKDKGE